MSDDDYETPTLTARGKRGSYVELFDNHVVIRSEDDRLFWRFRREGAPRPRTYKIRDLNGIQENSWGGPSLGFWTPDDNSRYGTPPQARNTIHYSEDQRSAFEKIREIIQADISDRYRA